MRVKITFMLFSSPDMGPLKMRTEPLDTWVPEKGESLCSENFFLLKIDSYMLRTHYTQGPIVAFGSHIIFYSTKAMK